MTDYQNYLFFFGANSPNGHFSNFYPSPMEISGKKYNCSEQYFMKMKQEMFDESNLALATEIMAETNPFNIKRLGRRVKNYNDTVWNANRAKVMEVGLKHKFLSNPILKAKLLASGDKILVEASPYDKIWGIGLNEKQAIQISPDKWPGQNLLGKLLMKIRDQA